jgi:ERCC4-related helicase
VEERHNKGRKVIPKIVDNNRRVYLDLIKQIAPKYDELSIATGYWDLAGTKLVIDELKNFKKIRLLIGREPLIPRHKSYRPEPDYPDADFYFDLERLIPDPALKQVVIEIKELIKKGVLEVKVYRKAFLHAKCYIFGGYSSHEAVGIIGSSNFTQNGLTHNTELNAVESDHRIVTFQPQTKEQEVGHLYWFDQLWSDPDSENWQGKFTELLEESPVGDVLFSPYETYIRTLYELYKEDLEDIVIGQNRNSAYELLEFQKRNVQHLLKKLDKYSVAMLSDSVGLGKTITAIEVVKHYTESDIGRKRVVIVCPKSLKPQWERELLKSGIPNLKPVVLQNLQAIEDEKRLDDIASVALFVIDESHNLRKTTGTRYEALLEWIKKNKKAHVLLLTATPINNELQDLTNQILLGTRGFGDSIKVTTVDPHTGLSGTKDFVRAVEDLQKKIKKQINQGQDVNYEEIKRVMGPIIRSIVVRRTRHGIEKEYGHLIIDGQERHFPKAMPEKFAYSLPENLVENVLSIKSEILDLKFIYSKNPEEIADKCTVLKHPLDQLDLIEKDLSEKELKEESPIYFVFQLILMLGFIPYRWRIYRTEYYGKTTEEIEDLKLPGEKSRELQQQRGIYGIFRTIFLKRMESSVRAIVISLDNYRVKLKLFEEGLKRNKIVGMDDIESLRTALESEDEDGLLEAVDKDTGTQPLILDEVDERKYNLDALKLDIKRELELIDVIQKQLRFFEQNDTKLAALVDLLKRIDKEKPAGEKVLVFSYFADTINYLEEKLKGSVVTEKTAAFVSSKNRQDADDYASLFSPKSKIYSLKEGETELKYLFSTDVLSEGQNLQDCGVIVNYDLHWNPVRMIQRNGRINRLGSMYDRVFVYNMNPLQKLDVYLRLVKRLEGKINMINNTIGNDQSVLGEAANPIEYIENLKDLYSEEAQKRAKAMEDLEKAGDFLLVEDDFILDLKKFDRNEKNSPEYKTKIYRIPRGKWAILPDGQRGNEIEIMVLSSLFNDETRLVPEFIKMNLKGSNRSAMTTLEALQRLKTDETQNQRKPDRITCDKASIRVIAQKPESYVIAEEGEQTPTGQKLELLRIMSNLHYSPEDIDIVGAAFGTKNYLDKKEIDKLVRTVVKANKENKPYQDTLNGILKRAKEIVADKEDSIKPNRVENILIYVGKNS